MFPSFAALLQKFFLCEEDFQGAEELQVSYSLNEGTSNLLFLNEFVTSKETQVLKLSFNRCTSGLMGQFWFPENCCENECLFRPSDTT